MQKKRLHRSLLVLLLLVLTGCTSTFVYRNLDWLTYWYVDDYIELTDEQELIFDPILEDYLAWHKGSQLQLYRDQLRLLRAQLQQGLSEQDVNDHLVAIQGFGNALMAKAAPGMVEIIISASPQQIADFIEVVNEQTDKRQVEFAKQSAEKRAQEYQERVEKRFEFTVGRLTDQQKTTITEFLATLEPTFEDRIQFRRQWLVAFANTVSAKDTTLEWEQQVTQLIANGQALRAPEYDAKLQRNTQRWVAFIVAFSRTLNAKQQQRLLDNIDEWIHDISSLMGSESSSDNYAKTLTRAQSKLSNQLSYE